MSPETELLTALSTQPFSATEDQWKPLLRRLFLPMAYIPDIQAVLEKGRWKTQPDPMAYIRKGSLRCAVRLGIVDGVCCTSDPDGVSRLRSDAACSAWPVAEGTD